MDFWVILYSLICVVVGGGAVTFLYKRNQSVGAMIALVLLIAVFILFGLRWFPGGNLNGSQPKGGAWPPIVNMCPDFMVSWTNPADSKIYCYDAANIYGLRAPSPTPSYQVGGLTINNVASQSALLLQNPRGTDTKLMNPLQNTFEKSASTITADTTAKWLRWEGVWDGRLVTADRITAI